MIDKLPTGVPGLDIITHGGIAAGRSTLLVGRSGTGKTILALQIAGELVRRGVKTILVTVEEPPEDLLTTADQLDFGLSEAVRQGALIVADVTHPLEGPTIVSGDYDLDGLMRRVESLVREHGARAIVVDSITALFSPVPPQALLRTQFFQLIHTFRRLGLTAVLVGESSGDYGQLTTLGVEDYVCDAVVVLRNVVDNERRRRSIEVNKYRRSAHYKGEYPFTITRTGIRIFPLDVIDTVDSSTSDRYSSGVEGLDTMTGGGWIRDSIVIVRGPTGSGKTLLAGMYARAGAGRGERVVYCGFEETKPILMRNFAEIGMPMEELERGGSLRVVCRYPEALSLEDLLVALRLEMEELAPSLIVLDSISSIEHASSGRAFRQFMIGMAALLREHGRSALITQTVAAHSEASQAAPYLSTIADSIVTLDYDADAQDLRRTMRVLKMRGSKHDTEQRRLTIEPGGIRVEPNHR